MSSRTQGKGQAGAFPRRVKSAAEKSEKPAQRARGRARPMASAASRGSRCAWTARRWSSTPVTSPTAVLIRPPPARAAISFTSKWSSGV